MAGCQLEIVSSGVGVLMTTITDYTGIIEIDGVYYIVEDGQAYYFDDTDNEASEIRWHSALKSQV